MNNNIFDDTFLEMNKAIKDKIGDQYGRNMLLVGKMIIKANDADGSGKAYAVKLVEKSFYSQTRDNIEVYVRDGEPDGTEDQYLVSFNTKELEKYFWYTECFCQEPILKS